MRTLLGFLAALLTVMHAVPSFAAVTLCPKSEVETNLAIVFGNGMFTAIDEAHESLERLKETTPEALAIPGEAIDYGLAYNYNEPFVEQLWEVFRQRLAATPSEFMRYLSSIVPWPEIVRDAALEAVADFEQLAYIGDEDLRGHVQAYREHLKQGKSVVVIAHSQGNLYANAAYDRLFETGSETTSSWKNSFGIVSVANPSTRVAGRSAPGCPTEGCYTTLKEDDVIWFVSIVPRDTLDWNIQNSTYQGNRKVRGGDVIWPPG